jgi:hypothetical protein
MKLRWKILISLGIFLLFAALSAWFTAHHRPERAVEKYKELLRNHGERLELDAVLPPGAPEASNGMKLAEAAFGSSPAISGEHTNQPPAMQMIGPGRAIVCSQQPFWFSDGDALGSNSWDNATIALDPQRSAMELLRQASVYPVLDFQVDYRTNFFDPPEEPLYQLVDFSTRFRTAALCDLHAGDCASAVTNICTLLKLVQATRAEPRFAAQESRHRMMGAALSATWELLQSPDVRDENLAELQSLWQQLDLFTGDEDALLVERAWGERLTAALHESLGDFLRAAGTPAGGSSWSRYSSTGNWLEDIKGRAQAGWQDVRENSGVEMWRSVWGFDDELRMLQNEQIKLEAVRAMRTNGVIKPLFDRMQAQLAALRVTNAPGAFLRAMEWDQVQFIFSGLLFGRSDRDVETAFRIDSIRQIVVVAVALKRFQLRHGKFPEKISELAPEFLPATPLDPMDGKQLRYKRNDDGTFLLYSVGVDGVDDGGDASPPKTLGNSGWNWIVGRDWVWPQPADVATVRVYYDGLAAEAAVRPTNTLPWAPPPPP